MLIFKKKISNYILTAKINIPNDMSIDLPFSKWTQKARQKREKDGKISACLGLAMKTQNDHKRAQGIFLG